MNQTSSHGMTQGSYTSYTIGFALSVALTLAAYLLVKEKVAEGYLLYGMIVLLGIIQVGVQMRFFLHLGEEPKPQWNVLSFIFMLLVIFILVIGTLWIMYNLDYRTMRGMPSMEQLERMQP